MTNKNPQNHSGHSTVATITLISFGYFTLNALSQYFFSGIADLDQAEQLISAQFLEWGYGPQPPLYTWIVHFIFQVTGANLISLLIFKAVLLSLLILGMAKIAAHLNFNNKQIWLTILAMALIPQIVWESQRDLTHSVLSAVLAAWTLYFTLKILQTANLKNYLWLGVFCGLGLLAKYNFILFITALVLAILLSPRYRNRLFNYRLLASIAVAAVIILPHFAWTLDNIANASAGVQKLETNGNVLLGLLEVFKDLILFLTPLWLIALFFLPWSKKQTWPKASDEIQFLLKLLISVIVLAMLFVIATQSENFKDRWYLPLLFFTPLLFAFYAKLEHSNRFIAIACMFALLVAVLLPLRNDYPNKAKAPLPSSNLSAFVKSNAELQAAEMIISDSKQLAGNIKMALPNTTVVSKTALTQIPNIAEKPKKVYVCINPKCFNSQQPLQSTEIYLEPKKGGFTIYWQSKTID